MKIEQLLGTIYYIISTRFNIRFYFVYTISEYQTSTNIIVT